MRLRSLVLASALLSLSACLDEGPDLGESEDEALVNFVICHDRPNDGVPPQTIAVGLLALASHLGHGDQLGACPVACAAEGSFCAVASDCCQGACQAGQCVTVCEPNSVAACYPGPGGTAGVGECEAGTRTCDARGASYGACTGAVTPSPDTCGDELDNDCDGAADDGCCTALPEVCGDGLDNDCDGAVDDGCCTAAAEVCDGADNDCDGAVDDGCVTGWAWGDFDVDGVQGPEEDGLADITFVLHTADGAVLATTTSDEDGYYAFAGVPTFTLVYVELVPPTFYQPTTPHAGGDPDRDSDFGENHRTDDVSLDDASSIDLDCGLWSEI